jgi:lysophospholipase L1-like esterase
MTYYTGSTGHDSKSVVANGQRLCPKSRKSLTRCRRINLILAFAVLYVASGSVCGSSAAIAPTPRPEKPVFGPPSVVFIGDSITAIWGGGQEGPEFAEHPNWIDKGVSGQTSSQVLARFQTDVLDLNPRIVHILVGTNDVYPGWTLEPYEGTPGNGIDSVADVEAMVKMAQANYVHVILATIPPWGCDAANCSLAEAADPTPSRYARIDAWNAWIEEYALSQGIPVVDYHSALLAPDGERYVPELTLDGVHPSAAGFVVMTPMVENVINAIASLYATK